MCGVSLTQCGFIVHSWEGGQRQQRQVGIALVVLGGVGLHAPPLQMVFLLIQDLLILDFKFLDVEM